MSRFEPCPRKIGCRVGRKPERVEYSPTADEQALAAFSKLARLEGIIPALESAHAVHQAAGRLGLQMPG